MFRVQYYGLMAGLRFPLVNPIRCTLLSGPVGSRAPGDLKVESDDWRPCCTEKTESKLEEVERTQLDEPDEQNRTEADNGTISGPKQSSVPCGGLRCKAERNKRKVRIDRETFLSRNFGESEVPKELFGSKGNAKLRKVPVIRTLMLCLQKRFRHFKGLSEACRNEQQSRKRSRR